MTRIIKLIFVFICLIGVSSSYSEVPMMNKNPYQDIIPGMPPPILPPSKVEAPIANTSLSSDKEVESAKESPTPTISVSMVQKSFSDKNSDKEPVKQFIYNPNRIYSLSVREAMSTTIVLPSNEKIAKIIVGDENSFLVEQQENNILEVFPEKVHRDTSLVVITSNKNIYPFYIKSISFESKNLPDMLVRIRNGINDYYNYSHANFKAANSNVNVTTASSNIDTENNKSDFVDTAPIDPSNINWNYKMKGNKSIAPRKVWNDGYFTYLDFGSKTPQKDVVTAYLVKDKVDTPVNSRWMNNVLVVEAIGNITLLNGKKYACIELLS